MAFLPSPWYHLTVEVNGAVIFAPQPLRLAVAATLAAAALYAAARKSAPRFVPRIAFRCLLPFFFTTAGVLYCWAVVATSRAFVVDWVHAVVIGAAATAAGAAAVFAPRRLSRLLPTPAAVLVAICAAAEIYSSARLVAAGCSNDAVALGRLAGACCLLAASACTALPARCAQTPSSATSSDTYSHTASLFSRWGAWAWLSLGGLDPLLALGAARPLEVGDVPALPASASTSSHADAFTAALAGAAATYGENTRCCGCCPRRSPRTPARRLFALLALRLHRRAFFVLGALQAASVALSFASPLLLNRLLSFLDAPGDDDSGDLAMPWVGLGWAAAIVAAMLASAALSAHTNVYTALVQARLRAGILPAVHSAMVTGNNACSSGNSAASLAPGSVVNFVSSDVQRVMDAVGSLHQLWGLPLQVGINLGLLYTQVKLAFVAGLAVLVLLTPLNVLVSKRIGALTSVMMTARDARVALVSETLAGIRAVKALALEVALGGRIAAARRAEVAALAARKYLDAVCVFLWASTPVLVSTATFSVVVALGSGSSDGSLTPSTVFTALALLNMLIFPLNAFPWILTGSLEAWVSLGRLGEALLGGNNANPQQEEGRGALTAAVAAAEGSPTTVLAHLEPGRYAFPGVGGTDASAPSSFALCIPVAGITVCAGEVIVVTGAVGSGKSAMLGALAGELQRCDGARRTRHALAPGVTASFAPETPFVAAASVTENVGMMLGTTAATGEVTGAALAAVCLDRDLADSGRGTNSSVSAATLSGGQAARLSLARAVATPCDLLLADDVLSPLDPVVRAAVARNLLARQPRGQGGVGLGASFRACVLVSTDPAVMAVADRVVVVAAAAGGPEGGASTTTATVVFEGAYDAAVASGHVTPPLPPSSEATDAVAIQAQLQVSLDADAAAPGTDVADTDGGSEAGEGDELEARRRGKLEGRVVSAYLRAVGIPTVTLVLVFLTVMQAAKNGNDFWLSVWSSAVAARGGSGSSSSSSSSSLNPSAWLITALAHWSDAQFLHVLLAVSGVALVATAARSLSFAKAGLAACVTIHDRLLAALLAAPLSFHDAQPIGRLTNRLGADQASTDESLPFQANILCAQAWGLVGTCLVLGYATWGALLLLVPPLALLYNRTQTTYRASSRELKRLSAAALSPLLTQLAEDGTAAPLLRVGSIHRGCGGTGATTTTASLPAAIAVRRQLLLSRLDTSQRVNLTASVASQWLSLRLQGLGALIIAAIAVGTVVVRVLSTPAWALHVSDACPAGFAAVPVESDAAASSPSDSAFAGLVGLALSYALPVVGAVQGLLSSFADTERELVSVERALEFSDVQPEEGAMKVENGRGSEAAAAPRPAALSLASGDGDDDGGGIDEEAPGRAWRWWRRQHRGGRHRNRSASLALPLLSSSRQPSVVDGNVDDQDELGETGQGLVLHHVYVTYAGQPQPALRDVSLAFRPGVVVGICGRTGAGKSTLLAAVHRLVPTSAGAIALDGRRVDALPLGAYRAALVPLPQALLIFEGTVAANLDPGGEWGPLAEGEGGGFASQSVQRLAELALFLVGLGEAPDSWGSMELPGLPPAAAARLAPLQSAGVSRFTPSTALASGGTGISRGEAQLLCLARTLMRGWARLSGRAGRGAGGLVVTLDEPVSAGEGSVARAALALFRALFPSAVILVVAHSPALLTDCDRVVLLDDGAVAEDGPPSELLQRRPPSAFAALVAGLVQQH